MKILLVTPVYEPAWMYGGVVNSNCTLCRALAQLGASVTVYTTNASKSSRPLAVPLNRPVDVGGVTVYYFESTFGPNNTFHSRALVKKLWQTVSDYDVVYVVALWQWIGIQAAKICHKTNVPMVVAIKGGFSKSLRRKSYIRKQVFRMCFLRRALKRAAAIHLTSEAEREAAGSWLAEMPALYLPNAVDPKKYSLSMERRRTPHILYEPDAVDPERYYSSAEQRRVFREKHGIPANSPVVICVARPDWKKRVDLLIGGLRKMREWHLVFVGEHTCEKGPEWKKYAETLGVSERVHWPGFLAGRDLLAALSASDLFALVSENENFGMVVVEAMLCGLPVMVSKEVGVWEFIKDEPFTIVAERTVESIVEGMASVNATMLSSQIDRDYIKQVACKKFAPPVVARHFMEELKKLLNGKDKSAPYPANR